MKSIVSSLMLASLLSFAAHAEDFNRVVIGAHYYAKGWFSDSEVQALAADHSSEKIKVLVLDTDEVSWVPAEDLVSASESMQRDLGRLALAILAGAAAADAMDNSSANTRAAPRETWVAGRPHPTHPHVVADVASGNWVPEPGYAWISDSNQSFAVRWAPGRSHSTGRPNVISTEREGYWLPAAGYEWSDRNQLLVQPASR